VQGTVRPNFQATKYPYPSFLLAQEIAIVPQKEKKKEETMYFEVDQVPVNERRKNRYASDILNVAMGKRGPQKTRS